MAPFPIPTQPFALSNTDAIDASLKQYNHAQSSPALSPVCVPYGQGSSLCPFTPPYVNSTTHSPPQSMARARHFPSRCQATLAMPMSARKSRVWLADVDSAVARSHGLGRPRERTVDGKKASGLLLTSVTSPELES